MKKLIPGLVLALLATMLTVAPAAAWHVKQSCELIQYDGYAYQVYTSDYQLLQDWTKGDTEVAPGTYKVKFTNGEKQKVEVPACPKDPSIIASGMLCGDPRAWFRYENTGNVDLDVTFSFLPGDKTQVGRRTFTKTVPADTTRTFGSRWVRGKVRVGVIVDGQWNKLYAYKVGTTLTPKRWGRAGCPDDRFGQPDWSAPHIAGAYGRITPDA